MGGSSSSLVTKRNTNKLFDALEQTAAHVILSQNFKERLQLQDKAYCDRSIIITKDIFKRALDLETLHYMVENIDGSKGRQTDKILNLTQHVSDKERERMCAISARYYIRIAQIYAAIMKVVDPHYKIPNSTKLIPMLERKSRNNADLSIDKKNRGNLVYNGFVPSRIKNLGYNIVKREDGTPIVEMQNKVCGDITLTSAMKIPGLMELRSLYFDVFNPETNKFDRMSVSSAASYKEHVDALYKALNPGETDVPDSVSSFEDITYSFDQTTIGDLCKMYNPNATRAMKYRAKKNSVDRDMLQNFADDLNNLRSMYEDVQPRLIKELGKLFQVKTFSAAPRKRIELRKLTMTKVDSIATNVRDILSDFYRKTDIQYRKTIVSFSSLFDAVKSMQKGKRNRDKLRQQEKRLFIG